MRVSVVVVVYNHEAILGQCLESIVPQLRDGDEVLVCDDASPDGSVAVANGWADRHPEVRVIAPGTNVRMSANTNRGLEAAQGDLVAIIAGDDAMVPGKLERQRGVFEKDPSVALCYHDAWVMDDTLTERVGRIPGPEGFAPDGVGVGSLMLSHGNPVPGPTGMVRRSLTGDLRFDPRVDMCSDRLYWAACAQRGSVRYVPEPLSLYRRHDQSMTARQPGRARRAFDAAMQMFDIAEREYGFSRSTCSQGRALAGWRLMKDALVHRDRRDLASASRQLIRRPLRGILALRWDQRHRLR